MKTCTNSKLEKGNSLQFFVISVIYAISAGSPTSTNSASNEEAREKSDAMPNISDVMLRKLKLHRGLPGWCVTYKLLLKLIFCLFVLLYHSKINLLMSYHFTVYKISRCITLTVSFCLYYSAPPLTEKEVEVGI